MFQTFPLLHPELPIVEIGGCVVLLDTGATHTILAPVRPSADHPLAGLLLPDGAPGGIAALMGGVWPAIEQAVRQLGYTGPLHGLVGVDRLAAVDLLVDVPKGVIGLRPRAASPTVGPADLRLRSSVSFGLPVVSVRFAGVAYRAALDTGANLGYLVGAPPPAAVPGPVAVDFHPVVGAFQTPTYRGDLEVVLEDESREAFGTVSMGRLEGMLAISLQMAGLDAALGGAIFRHRAVLFLDGLARVVLPAQS